MGGLDRLGSSTLVAAAMLLSACATSNDASSPSTAGASQETAASTAPSPDNTQPADTATGAAADDGAYDEQSVLEAAESVFGKGAKGLAKLIEDIVDERGEPTAYIVGREGSGAIGIGLRYGAGTLYHRVEGEREVYWTGPSIGLDLGGDANRVFTLVYDLYDTEDLYRRYPAAEGKVYVVGGFTANFLQRDDVAVVPVKLGVGVRLGANVGYLNFTKKRRIMPF
ncbi:MAG: DUF1134 domain-containing protein [Pseudomonadota bacterium]